MINQTIKNVISKLCMSKKRHSKKAPSVTFKSSAKHHQVQMQSKARAKVTQCSQQQKNIFYSFFRWVVYYIGNGKQALAYLNFLRVMFLLGAVSSFLLSIVSQI